MNELQKKTGIEILRIIWIALLSSQFVYAAVLNFVLSSSEVSDTLSNQFIIPILSTTAATLYFVAILFPKYLLNVEKDKLKQRSGETVQKMGLNDLVDSYRTPFIIRMALFEAVTILGFVLALINRNFELLIPFISASVVAFVVIFPTEEKIRNSFK